jgi:hypothetical protein
VPSLKCLRRIPAPIAPVIQSNVDFQIEIVPADGIRLPFPASGEFGTSPFFGQHLVKLISSTVRQRSISGCATHSEFASTHPPAVKRRLPRSTFAAREAGSDPSRKSTARPCCKAILLPGRLRSRYSITWSAVQRRFRDGKPSAFAMQQPHTPFLARTENDRGMRGWPSGSRHHPSGAGTSIGTPCHGNTSCSRNIVIISPESISAPRIADSGCIHSRVD